MSESENGLSFVCWGVASIGRKIVMNREMFYVSFGIGRCNLVTRNIHGIWVHNANLLNL